MLTVLDAASVRPDDPTGLLAEAAAATWPAIERSRPRSLRELEEAKLGFDEAKHPRWPKGAPGGLGGQFMRVGQIFEAGGKVWEIDHVFANRVVAHEASGKYSAAEVKEFDTTATPGPDNELGGIKRPSAKSIKGGKQGSTVTVVEPYSDPSTHDPSIPIPPGSTVSAEEWAQFGRLEQLHYAELQNRYGKHTASGAANLIKQAYNEYDAHTQEMVSGSYSEQYGSSTGWSLSLTKVFSAIFGKKGADVEKARERRERARELQSLIRDAYAWDLYNRTHSPDVAMFHKDKHNQTSATWRAKHIDGNEPIFSGLSQSHHFRSSFWSQQTGLAHAVSIRHVVMATWISGPMKGAKKSFTSEREIAVPYQLKLDDRTMSFHNKEIPQSYRDWLEDQTDHPASGDIFRMFKAAVEEGAHLPTPPPKPKIEMHGKGWLPPPQAAADALEEYQQKLPGGGTGNWSGTPQDLAKFDLPFANVDESGVPVAKIASESGYNPGDYLMGKKGTLYWLGPNPGDTSGLGLMIHKIVPDGQGGLTFNGENFAFKDGIENYKLAGNFPPPKVEGSDWDPDGWTHDVGRPVPISKLAAGDKIKVDGTAYELVDAPGPVQTTIKDLDTGITGTINSEYQTLPLVPKEGYVIASGLKPAKGLTFAYEGKKHTITNVTKDGVVSAKPVTAGSTVVKLSPDDPALAEIFDPSAWTKAKGQLPASALQEGDHFTTGRGKTIRPHKVTGNDGTWTYWTNLDTGETGKSLGKKKLTPLLQAGEDGSEPEAVISPPPQPEVTWEELKFGDSVQLGKLKVGDQVADTNAPGSNATYQLVKAPDPADPESKWVAAVVEPDGSIGAAGPLGSDTKQVTLVGKNVQPPESEQPGAHHGYSSGQEVELKKKFGEKTWKATVVGSTKTPGGEDALEVQATTKAGPKVYTVKLDKVVTEPNHTPAAPGTDGPGTDEAPEPLPDTDIAFDTLPTLSEETFPAYKSSHGPGGKYKHDRIEAMPTGMVFQDKTGALWKVVESGSTPTVTDGQQNYKINGKLRGRALPDESWDKPTPSMPHAVHATLPPEPSRAEQAKKVAELPTLVPNTDGLTVADLPDGSYFQGGSGKTYAIVGDKVVDPVTGVGFSKGIVMTENPITPPQVLLPPKPAPSLNPAEVSVGDVEQGQDLPNLPGAKVVAHTASDQTIVQYEGQLHQLESGMTLDFADAQITGDATAAAEPAEDALVGGLEPDDEFEGAGGHPFMVVSPAAQGVVVMDMQSKELTQVPFDSPLDAVKPVPVKTPQPTDEFAQTVGVTEDGGHEPGAVWAEGILAKLPPVTDLPKANLNGFKSAWGTGAKYKHPHIPDLAPGAKFRDKSKTEYIYLGKHSDATGWAHVIYDPATGDSWVAPINVRVRELE